MSEPTLAGADAETEIFVEGLAVRARVGIHAAEQARSQPLVIDFSLRARLGAPVRVLGDTLCYEALSRQLTTEVEARHHPLLEDLAERLAGLLLEDARVVEVSLRLSKPEALAGARAAGVAVRRRRG